MMPTVIVYGPMACGKTHNAQAIARQFGIPETNIIDCWDDHTGKRKPRDRREIIHDGHLHLTNREPYRLASYLAAGVIVKDYADLGFPVWKLPKLSAQPVPVPARDPATEHASISHWGLHEAEPEFVNPIRWFYAFSEDAENWSKAGNTREEALAHLAQYREPTWLVAAHRMEPNFKLFEADELMERISEDECWWENGWEGAPDSKANAELEDALATVLRRWVAKHGDLDGAMLDFVEGPELIEPAPKPEAA